MKVWELDDMQALKHYWVDDQLELRRKPTQFGKVVYRVFQAKRFAIERVAEAIEQAVSKDPELMHRAVVLCVVLKRQMHASTDRDLFRQLARDVWLAGSKQFRTVSIGKVHSDDCLGQGVCFHNALRAHVFRLENPDGTDEELAAAMLKGGIYSQKDRFYQAQYQLATLFGERGFDHLAPLAVRDHNLQELQAGVGSRADAMGTLQGAVLAQTQLLKGSNNSTLLTWAAKDGGHAIQVDLSTGHMGFWDPNYGRFSYASREEFWPHLQSYLIAAQGFEFALNAPIFTTNGAV